jgi:hypothetical protein
MGLLREAEKIKKIFRGGCKSSLCLFWTIKTYVWLESQLELSGSILVFSNGVVQFFVWQAEQSHFIFCLVEE